MELTRGQREALLRAINKIDLAIADFNHTMSLELPTEEDRDFMLAQVEQLAGDREALFCILAGEGAK